MKRSYADTLDDPPANTVDETADDIQKLKLIDVADIYRKIMNQTEAKTNMNLLDESIICIKTNEYRSKHM